MTGVQTCALPIYVVLNMGTNDAIFGDILTPARPDMVTEYALAWLHQMRAYLPYSQVFIVVPFGGFYASMPSRSGYLHMRR